VNREHLKYWAEYYNKQEGRKYPCSNQTVICGIITDDRDKALNFMKDKEFIRKHELLDQIVWVLPNGEIWKWRNWNETIRGYRFYKVAVDENVNDELFEFLILPLCSLYCCSMEII
jgi:hypothetical protein